MLSSRPPLLVLLQTIWNRLISCRTWLQQKWGTGVLATTSKGLLVCLQVSLVTVLVVEFASACREAYDELYQDDDGTSSAAGGVTSSAMASRPVMNRRSAQKLIAWMKEEQQQQMGKIAPSTRNRLGITTRQRRTTTSTLKPPPRSIRPAWMIPLARDLKRSCSSISWKQLEDILVTVTVRQATMLRTCLLRPTNPKVTFDSIGGLNEIKTFLQEWVSLNQKGNYAPSLPYDALLQNQKEGIVLWGFPGCGKSMLMQAVATESGRPTLFVTPSLIKSKWYGESNAQIRTLFGLVAALGPCTILLDEVDGLFFRRGDEEHESSRDLKTEWLQWWDGISASQLRHQDLLVIASSNRPWDIDPGAWRRLRRSFYVGYPSEMDRCDLFRRWIKSYDLPSVQDAVIQHFAEKTSGYSASGLFQLVQEICAEGPVARGDSVVTFLDVDRVVVSRYPTTNQQYHQQMLSFFHSNPPENWVSESTSSEQEPEATSPVYQEPHVASWVLLDMPAYSEVSSAMEHLWQESSDEDSDLETDYEDSDDDDVL